MSKIKEIYVEARKSKNYQTYATGMTIIIEEGDNVEEEKIKAREQCRKHVIAEIEKD